MEYFDHASQREDDLNMFILSVIGLKDRVTVAVLDKVTTVFERVVAQDDFYVDNERFNYNHHKWLRELRNNERMYLVPPLISSFRRLLHVLERCYRRRRFITGGGWAQYLHAILETTHKDSCEDATCPWLSHICVGYNSCTILKRSPSRDDKPRLIPVPTESSSAMQSLHPDVPWSSNDPCPPSTSTSTHRLNELVELVGLSCTRVSDEEAGYDQSPN